MIKVEAVELHLSTLRLLATGVFGARFCSCRFCRGAGAQRAAESLGSQDRSPSVLCAVRETSGRLETVRNHREDHGCWLQGAGSRTHSGYQVQAL